jgi:hypothetical protein
VKKLPLISTITNATIAISSTGGLRIMGGSGRATAMNPGCPG